MLTKREILSIAMEHVGDVDNCDMSYDIFSDGNKFSATIIKKYGGEAEDIYDIHGIYEGEVLQIETYMRRG